MTTLHDFESKTIEGTTQTLSAYRGKTVLIVNVASKCGLTPQYDGLETLYKKYKDKDFAVLGFPCNQFGAQEPGTEAEIQTFCQTKFDVTFPMFSKVEVNGEGADPIYKWLTSSETEPVGKGPIAWNFAKFLVNGSGQVVARFAHSTTPSDPALVQSIEGQLS